MSESASINSLGGLAVSPSSLKENQSGWILNLFQQAGEASGSFRGSARPAAGSPQDRSAEQLTYALEHSRQESGRRARAQIRRYCAHNALNRLGTLTYTGEGCHDPHLPRIHLGAFFRELRQEVGRDFPYLWVPEWHATHGLHVHFAVGRYINRSIIEAAWPHGFVHIKLLGDLPHGSLDRDQARVASGYLAKYVGKGFSDDRNLAGLHRYDIAQGFRPKPTKLFAPTLSEVLSIAVDRMGGPYDYFWDSNDQPDWGKPPAVYLSW